MVTERSLKTWASVCQVSKIWNQIKPEKQSKTSFKFLVCEGDLYKYLEVSYVNFWGL